MKKISDDRMICVYEKTAEKLTQRGYANVMDEHHCIHYKYYSGKTPGVICFETEKEMWDKSNSLCYGKPYRGLCFYMYNENHIMYDNGGCSLNSDMNDLCYIGADHIHNGTDRYESHDTYQTSDPNWINWYLNHTLNTSERFEKFK